MANFSRQILNFLKSIQADPEDNVHIVPKGMSCAVPGDILFFRYSLKRKRGMRLFLVTEPVVKEARTGNILLTGFKMPTQGNYTPDSIRSLYTNKELPKENYRTYILSKIYGPLRRVRKK
jgi:hypothetical protein